MRKINKKDTKDFIWNAVGLSFNAFNSLFFLVAIKLINGIDDAGVFTYAFSLCCLFYIVALFYNRTYQVSENKEDFCFRDYLTFRGISTVLSLVLIFIFSLISQFSWYKIAMIMLLMIFKGLEAVADCFYGEMQKKEELYKTGVSLTLKSVIGFFVFLLVDILTHDLILAVLGLILTSAILLMVYDFRQVSASLREKVSISRANIRNLLKTTWPVFVFSLLSVFLTSCQKYVMTYFTDNEMQAIFGILIMPATVMGLVGLYLANPFTTKLSSMFSAGKMKEFRGYARRILFTLFLVGILAVVVCGFIGIPVLNWLYRMDLSEHKTSLMIIVASSVLAAATGLMSSFLTIMKENKKQSLIYAIVSGISVVLSIILISNFGINGGVLAYGASAGILMIVYIVLYRKKVRIKYNEKRGS